jgi:hypothetical protein
VTFCLYYDVLSLLSKAFDKHFVFIFRQILNKTESCKTVGIKKNRLVSDNNLIGLEQALTYNL